MFVHRSLLAPGIEMAAASKNYGSTGQVATLLNLFFFVTSKVSRCVCF
jgi:hypothetical protein